MRTHDSRSLTARAAQLRFATMALALIVLAMAAAGCAAPAAIPAAAPQATAAQSASATVPPTAVAQPVAAATPTSSMEAASAAPAILTIAQNDQLGQFLADEKGVTLYLYTKDTPNTSNCYDKCEAAWPPLFTGGAPVAAGGLQASLVGTTTRKDGKVQATYNGWPLYYWINDKKPGDTTGQGVGGVWYVISPVGEQSAAGLPQVAAAPAATVQAAPTPTAAPTVDDKGGDRKSSSSDDSVTIKIENFKFAQPVLTITAGTTVEWENEDTAAHTVTADDGSFDSGPLNKGDQFKFTFNTPGTYLYYCTYHGGPGGVGQSGQIIVK